jgi:hypothetical protein
MKQGQTRQLHQEMWRHDLHRWKVFAHLGQGMKQPFEQQVLAKAAQKSMTTAGCLWMWNVRIASAGLGGGQHICMPDHPRRN